MPLRDDVPALALAAQFLTRLPVRASFDAAAMARAPLWFALIGAGIGVAAALVLWAGVALFGPTVGALLSVTACILLTGGLHEDGLADTMDGLGGRDPEHSLEIMRDSRIGAYGVLALVLSVALRVAILSGLAAQDMFLAATVMVAGHAGSRFSMLVVMTTSRYLRSSGAGAAMTGLRPWPDLAIAGAPALVATLFLPPSAWLLAVFGLALGHGAARLAFRRLGGHTGDCLGAVQQLSLIGLGLAVLAWAG